MFNALDGRFRFNALDEHRLFFVFALIVVKQLPLQKILVYFRGNLGRRLRGRTCKNDCNIFTHN